MVVTLALLVGAFVAFYMLRGDRKGHRTKRGPLIDRANVKLAFSWKRLIGVMLLTILGALGATAMFSAARTTNVADGSPELPFLIGAALLISCYFIFRYMVAPGTSPADTRDR